MELTVNDQDNQNTNSGSDDGMLTFSKHFYVPIYNNH